MTVLMLQDTSNYAGTEAHILTLSRALLLDHTAVAMLVPKGSELEGRCQSTGVRCYVSSQSLGVFFFNVLALVKQLRPDVIHTHNGRTTLVGVIVAKLMGCKIIATQHFLEPAHTASRGVLGKLKRTLHQWLGRQIDYRICVSDAVLQSMRNRGDIIAKQEKYSSVIFNGIDIDNVLENVTKSRAEVLSEFGIREDTQIVLCAARLETEKNIPVLLDAFKILIDSGLDAQLIIAGYGAEYENLSNRIDALNLSEVVILAGFRNDVHSLMAASDIFVLPATNEPFGLVLLEAMLLHTPVIAARSGGPLEIIEHGATGLFFTPNDVHDLAEKMVFALNHTEAIIQMRNDSRGSVHNRFSSETMAFATRQAYSKAIQAGQ
jgi:glycogen(starch) synthase